MTKRACDDNAAVALKKPRAEHDGSFEWSRNESYERANSAVNITQSSDSNSAEDEVPKKATTLVGTVQSPDFDSAEDEAQKKTTNAVVTMQSSDSDTSGDKAPHKATSALAAASPDSGLSDDKAETCRKDHCTLFISSLSWNSTEESIKEFFGGCGKVEIDLFLDKYSPDVHKGRGLVHFESEAMAAKAIELDQTVLDGRSVNIRYNNPPTISKSKGKGGKGSDSKGRKGSDSKGGKGSDSKGRKGSDSKGGKGSDSKGGKGSDSKGGKGSDSKGGKGDAGHGEKPDGCVSVFVSNIGFSTNEDTIWKHFENCGPIRSVSIMRNRGTGESRGLAFVDFEATESTDRAVALAGSQMDGRRIFVQWKADAGGKKGSKGGNDGKGNMNCKGKGKGKSKGKADGYLQSFATKTHTFDASDSD